MLLKVNDVYKNFCQGGGFFSSAKKTVLKNVSLQIAHGECLGLIGESGSGKSTLGRMMIGIEPPDQGEVLFENQDIYRPSKGKQLKWRQNISAVFQDYTSSVNPRFQVRRIVAEPMQTHRIINPAEESERITYLLEKVGLGGEYLKRYPHELSGGQLQRVCIARAISTQPTFILLDEPVSSLDVSVQVQVMDLLAGLREEFNLSYLFISHDLAAVAYLCDRALFFAEGEVVEEVPRMEELGQVKAAYSRKLLHSVLDFSEYLPHCPSDSTGVKV